MERSEADLETLLNADDFETEARRILPPWAFAYVAGAAGSGSTAVRNRAAFGRWLFKPRVLVGVGGLDVSTTVLGSRVELPVLVAPFSQQALLHTDAEGATARGARAAGTLMVVSMGASTPLEEIPGPDTGPLWFQPYCSDDRGLMLEMTDRALSSGYEAICVTVDAPVAGWREAEMRVRAELQPRMRWANLPQEVATGTVRWLNGAPFDWEELRWLIESVSVPVVVKGILRGEDAVRAVELGARAVVVSNHGGRQLADCIAALEALPEVVAAVGDRVQVLMDGGVRRGTDVLKALALGARAVLIGRSAAWGLAVGGEAGVARVLEVIKGELVSAMAVVGAPSVAHLDPSLLEPLGTAGHGTEAFAADAHSSLGR